LNSLKEGWREPAVWGSNSGEEDQYLGRNVTRNKTSREKHKMKGKSRKERVRVLVTTHKLLSVKKKNGEIRTGPEGG